LARSRTQKQQRVDHQHLDAHMANNATYAPPIFVDALFTFPSFALHPSSFTLHPSPFSFLVPLSAQA